jgi:hypothetical protein
MDYSKSGNARRDKNIPRDPKVAPRGAPPPVTGGRENKAELLARMKAAAAAQKAGKPTAD